MRPAATRASSIGTHALIQEHVQFAELGLVVVDEQHRFGVEQRDALRYKSAAPPHLLVMTATPIPRTVAMTVFGDLETSTLTELPAGRSPIATSVVPLAEQPGLVRAGLAAHPRGGRRRPAGFIVCPRIGADMTEFEAELADVELPEEEVAGRRPPLAVSDVLPMLADGRARRPAARRRCTAGSSRTRRTARWPTSRPAGSTCWSRPPSSRSAWTCPNATVDGRPGRRPVRRLAAAPAARADRPGRACRRLPARHRSARGGAVARAARRRRRRPPTASCWPASTSSSAARATCSARPSPGGGRSSSCSRCCGTRT